MGVLTLEEVEVQLRHYTRQDCNQIFKMGKKDNSKAKEKKAERKAMEKKMNAGVANVKIANAVEDPLAQLPKPFSVFNKNGLDLTLETVRAPDLDEKTLVWAYDMVSTNMKPLMMRHTRVTQTWTRSLGGRKRRKRASRERILPGISWPRPRREHLSHFRISGLTWTMMTRFFTVMRCKWKRVSEGRVWAGL